MRNHLPRNKGGDAPPSSPTQDPPDLPRPLQAEIETVKKHLGDQDAVKARRVEALRNAILAGAYGVDPVATAKRMIGRLKAQGFPYGGPAPSPKKKAADDPPPRAWIFLDTPNDK